MNDRVVGILDNYELQVLRTWKGRGAILSETNQGIRILKEYHGAREKLYTQHKLLLEIKKAGFGDVEEIILNKEGEPFCVDMDRTTYIVKSYVDGRECNIKDEQETLNALKALARLHRAMKQPELAADIPCHRLPLLHEFEKRNKELRRVRKYLKEKRQKTTFESYLQRNFDYFFQKAVGITEELSHYPTEEWLKLILEEGSFSHGDYQYHNILYTGENPYLINFEKYVLEDQTKDLYLFCRKYLEKNNWSPQLGEKLLHTYMEENPLTVGARIQLLYRFLYPEKFWKIVNYYYNNTKAFIPSRNTEKLDKILTQESIREEFFEKVLRNIAL